MPSIFDLPAFTETLFFPTKSRARERAGLRDESVDVEGAVLRARIHEPAAGAIPVLFFYGNGETADDYDGLSARFRTAGLAPIVVDYRGYGGSTGSPALRTALADARAVWTWAAARWPQLWVMGRSLGSLPALEVAAFAGKALGGLIIESGIGDLFTLVARRGLAVPAAFTAADRADFDPLLKLALCQAPVCIVHGRDDDIIACSEAQRLYDAAVGAPRRTLHILDGFGHNDVHSADGLWQALAAAVSHTK